MQKKQEEIQYLDYIKPKGHMNNRKRGNSTAQERDKFVDVGQKQKSKISNISLGLYDQPNKSTAQNQAQKSKKEGIQIEDCHSKIKNEVNVDKQSQGVNLQNVKCQEKQLQQIKNLDLGSIQSFGKSQTENTVQLGPQIKKQPEPRKEKSYVFHNCQIWYQIRALQTCKADALIIPFKTQRLEYFPGTFFREKLAYQRQKITKTQIFNGGIYIKNNHNIAPYRFLVFLKTDGKEYAKHLTIGLGALLAKNLKDNLKITSILFFIDLQPSSQICLTETLKGITQCEQLKNVQKMSVLLGSEQEVVSQNECSEFDATMSTMLTVQK